ncbi:VWA domain-containing protein [Paracoccus mutanolyticus]|uniref:VWA domain-containing protein n=1 Tax=Paracoccus mutanolyticus TaxID=1499308 RepID=UPI001CB965AE|nr:VWA domain-containing protein [Paracoccus mutanolyticus]
MRQRRAAGEWTAVLDPALMPALRRLGLLTDGRHTPDVALPFLAALALVLALSGPAVLRPGAVEYRALDPLILAMDLSPSVAGDQRVLDEARSAAAMLLPLAQGRPVGLMLYAGDAYLASAPTSDAATLSDLIAVLSRDTMPVAGSRPDIALSMARDLFGGRDGPGLGGADLVLVTDGGGVRPRAVEEAARLASDGARVWALVLPVAAAGAPPPAPGPLADLARAGGGEAMPAADPPALMARIAARRTARLARDDTAGHAFWTLAPGCCPWRCWRSRFCCGGASRMAAALFGQS